MAKIICLSVPTNSNSSTRSEARNRQCYTNSLLTSRQISIFEPIRTPLEIEMLLHSISRFAPKSIISTFSLTYAQDVILNHFKPNIMQIILHTSLSQTRAFQELSLFSLDNVIVIILDFSTGIVFTTGLYYSQILNTAAQFTSPRVS
jgi:hypothetical protein